MLAGTEIPGYGGRVRLYLTLRCHHQNDSCTKMGSDESQFNVSLTVTGKATGQCPQTTNFEDRGEPKRNRTEVLQLTSLTPYRQAKPAHEKYFILLWSVHFLRSKFAPYTSQPLGIQASFNSQSQQKSVNSRVLAHYVSIVCL